MTQRKKQKPSAGGGNVLFTLGMVTVVAMLIVGWVMTQGGLGLSAKEMGLTTINVNPEPTPSISESVSLNTSSQRGPGVDALGAMYERQISDLDAAHKKQLQNMKKRYENQIKELKAQLQLLEMDNMTLRGS